MGSSAGGAGERDHMFKEEMELNNSHLMRPGSSLGGGVGGGHGAGSAAGETDSIRQRQQR